MAKLSELTRGGTATVRLSDLTITPAKRTPEEEEAELQRLLPGVSTDPTHGMSFAEKLGAGLGSSLAQTGRGIGQLLGLTSQEEVDEAAMLEAPLLDTGAGLVGNIAGHVGQIVVPAGAAFRYGSKVPGAVRAGQVLLNPRSVTAAQGLRGTAAGIGTAAAIGGGQAALQPVTSDESRAGNIASGAAFGAGGQAVGEVIGAAARPIIRALARGQQAEATAGDILRSSASRPGTIQAIQSGRLPAGSVPGSVPTTAEAARDPGLAGLERALRTKPETAPMFADRDAARNAARVQLIERTFEGASPEDAARLRAAVQTAQGPVIGEVKKATGAETGRVISWIDRAANTPRFRNAPKAQESLATVRGLLATPIDDAGRLAAARRVAMDAVAAGGRMSSKDFDAVREAARLVRGASARGESSDEVLKQVLKIKPTSMAAKGHVMNMARALRTAEKGKPDVASLYNARKYITQTLMPRAEPEQMFALRGAVAKLDETITEVAPAYKQYLSDYAQGMRRADQAAVGARFLSAGLPRPSDAVTPYALGARNVRVAENMDQLVQSATGFPRATAARTLTAEQRKAVADVARDLDSYAWLQQQSRASQNSITPEATAGQNRLSRMAVGVAANAIPGGGLGVAAADTILSEVGKRQGARVQAIVAEALQDPARAAQILATLPPDVRQQVIRLVGPTLGQLRLGAAAGYGGAALTGADAPMDIGTVSGYDPSDPRYQGD